MCKTIPNLVQLCDAGLKLRDTWGVCVEKRKLLIETQSGFRNGAKAWVGMADELCQIVLNVEV